MSPLTELRLAFAFPGVGVRLCGHEAALLARHAEVMGPRMACASERCGVDLLDALQAPHSPLRGLESELLAYGFSCALFDVYRARGVARPALVAGHSLGLYAALYAAGALSFDHGLDLLQSANELVARACAELDAGMAVVVGLRRQQVDELLQGGRGPGAPLVVNCNNDITVILAGERAELERLVAQALRRGAPKARLLPVRAPYHHPGLLGGVESGLRAEAQRLRWRRAACPLVSSIDQRPLREPSELVELVCRNLVTPIHWERVIEAIDAQGVDAIVECGAGLSLCQNGRLMAHCPPFITVKNAHRRCRL